MMLLDIPPLAFSGSGLHFSHRLLDWSDLEQVLAFRRDIFADIAPHFRVRIPPVDDVLTDELKWCEKHLRLPGVTIGVFDDNRLIAYASVLLSVGKGVTDISHLLGFNEQDLQRSAELSSCMVDKHFRGLGLQASLLRWRIELATKHERSLFIGMTACGNSYSLGNMLGAGMTIRWVGQIAPGRWFQGLMLDTQSHSQVCWSDTLSADWQDFAAQFELLDRGYEGVSIDFLEGVLNPEQYRIRFSKREASNT